MRKFFICIICVLYTLISNGQINESDSLNFKANLALTGIWQSGNVETLIFRAKSTIVYKPIQSIVFKTQNSYVYQEFGNNKADEDILSLNFLYLNPDKKLYPLALGFISTNFRRQIDLRTLLGLGATYQLLRKKKNWLKASMSLEYERTNFKSAIFNRTKYNGDDRIETLRGTVWVHGKSHLVEDKIIFSHESYFQPSLRDGDNYRWRTDIGLEFPIWKFLNFKINYLHTFESVVIENQKQEDRLLTFGFNLKTK